MAATPLDRLLSETDSPYLAPEPERGKVNTPLAVVRVVERIAAIKQVDAGRLQEQVERNVRRLRLATIGFLQFVSPSLQFLLAEATELAATGHYAEAEARLAAIPDGRKHPPVLDLLARIRAQQGRPAEAVEFWQMAVQMDPANPEYRAGLAYVEKALKKTISPNRLPSFFLPLLA